MTAWNLGLRWTFTPLEDKDLKIQPEMQWNGIMEALSWLSQSLDPTPMKNLLLNLKRKMYKDTLYLIWPSLTDFCDGWVKLLIFACIKLVDIHQCSFTCSKKRKRADLFNSESTFFKLEMYNLNDYSLSLLLHPTVPMSIFPLRSDSTPPLLHHSRHIHSFYCSQKPFKLKII